MYGICPDAVPENAVYKIYGIFILLDVIIINFKNSSTYIMGELNSRCGTPDFDPHHIFVNPDPIINTRKEIAASL